MEMIRTQISQKYCKKIVVKFLRLRGYVIAVFLWNCSDQLETNVLFVSRLSYSDTKVNGRARLSLSIKWRHLLAAQITSLVVGKTKEESKCWDILIYQSISHTGAWNDRVVFEQVL